MEHIKFWPNEAPHYDDWKGFIFNDLRYCWDELPAQTKILLMQNAKLCSKVLKDEKEKLKAIEYRDYHRLHSQSAFGINMPFVKHRFLIG